MDWRNSSWDHPWINVWLGVLMRKGAMSLFDEKCPCDDCRYKEDCKKNDWACTHFLRYIVSGSCYLDVDRNPTRSLFVKIFKDEDLDLRKIVDGQEELL